MQKQGNQHSPLLKKFAETAASTKKEEVSFDETILEALKQTKPDLRNIIADVAKGKNIHKTAQWDSIAKPMPEPPLGEGLQDGEGPHGFGGPDDLGAPEDSLDTNPVEPEGDTESAKNNMAQALVDLCGSPEAACDCINALARDGMGEDIGEPGLEEPVDAEPIDDTLNAPMEAQMPAPMEMPSIM